MDEDQILQISWDDKLYIAEGDEVEISQGWVNIPNVRAAVIHNISAGRIEQSHLIGVIMSNPPKEISPPIRGFVKKN